MSKRKLSEISNGQGKFIETHETMSREDFMVLAFNLARGGSGRKVNRVVERTLNGDTLSLSMSRRPKGSAFSPIISRRDGNLEIMTEYNNRPIAKLERFPNGEFRLAVLNHFVQSAYKLEWGRFQRTIDPILRCTGCSMSSFKSCVNEAIEGRASLLPRNWLSFSSYHSIKDLVDVLICQNSHCGISQDVVFGTNFGVFICTATSKVEHSRPTAETQRQRQDILSLLSVPAPLARLIADFLGPLQMTFQEPTQQELKVSRHRTSGFHPTPNKQPMCTCGSGGLLSNICQEQNGKPCPGNGIVFGYLDEIVSDNGKCLIDKDGLIVQVVVDGQASRVVSRLKHSKKLHEPGQPSMVLAYRYIPDEERTINGSNYKIGIVVGEWVE